jgi:predicted RNase H-like HicB family nuclease
VILNEKVKIFSDLEPSDDGGFGVYFPHLPKSISYGSNEE